MEIVTKRIFLLVAAFFLFGISSFVYAASVTPENAYKSIVRIYTYYEDEHGELSLQKSGSGVIIRSDGLALTNNHVVSIQDGLGNELPVALNICLTTTKDGLPKCDYAADIIARNEEQDLALIKLRNTPVGTLGDLQKVNRALSTNNIKDGELLYAWGYPAVGGGTITKTQGTFSGRLQNGAQSFIKTDAAVSLGSSGGALLDSSGQLIGITTAIKTDVGGSLGMAIDIETVNSWIDANSDKKVTNSTLAQRLDNYLVAADKYVTGASLNERFVNTKPYFTITRPSNYEIVYDDETGVRIRNYEDKDGGDLAVLWGTFGIMGNRKLDDFIQELTFVLPTCTTLGNITLDKVTGRHVLCTIDGHEVNYYIMPVKNYIISFVFSYGTDYKDWDPIRTMLKSITFDEDKIQFTPLNSFEHYNPYFKISASRDWGLTTYNSATSMLAGQTEGQSMGISIERLTNSQKDVSNDKYFNLIAGDDTTKSGLEKTFDSVDRFDIVTNYHVNNEFPSEVRYSYRVMKNAENRKFIAVYRIRHNGYAFVINYTYLGWDEGDFVKHREAFEKNVLANFSVGKTVEQPPAQSVNEVTIVPKQLQGQLIKGASSSAVYLLKDGKRWVFPNERIFYSWYENFDSVKTITDQELAQYSLGGNLIFKPGTLIKIPSIPKVYVIVEDNKMRWVETEDAAKKFFGNDWAKQVRDVGVSYFINYEEIESVK